MARILITPDQVDDVARQFEQAAEESNNMVSRLQSTMGTLDAEWDGVAQQRFYQDWQQWHGDMLRYGELLQNIAQQLHAVAARFRAADEGA